MSHGFTVEEYIHDKLSVFQVWLFGGLLSLCRRVLQLRNSWQAVKILSVAVWWPIIPMSHGFTVKKFMTSCQNFKCGCLVTNNRFVAWFYSWGLHDRLSRFEVRLFGGLSFLCRMVLQLKNSWQAVKISNAAVWWPMIPMAHGFTVEVFMTW